jgi:hypothetical protein
VHVDIAEAMTAWTCLGAEADGSRGPQGHNVGVGCIGSTGGRRGDGGVDAKFQAGAMDGVALQRRSTSYWNLAFVQMTAYPVPCLSTDGLSMCINVRNRCCWLQA